MLKRFEGCSCGGIGRRSGLKIRGTTILAGSSPATSTNDKYRGVEQLVARRAHNPEVVGSNPASATKYETPVTINSQGFFDALIFCIISKGRRISISQEMR